VILVTSATPEEGKTTIAAALAAASELVGRHALLVECDLRNPRLAERLELAKTPGLTEYIAGRAPLVDVVQKVEVPVIPNGDRDGDAAALSCIVAGSAVPQPVSLLRSEKVRQFLETASGAYDVVVIDAAPVLPVADTLQVIPAADAVLLCLRASKTTRNQAEAAKTLLERFPDMSVGTVLTGLRLAEDVEQYSSAYVYGVTSKRR
jgi:capsular exopolysaccharide synthesis family protein